MARDSTRGIQATIGRMGLARIEVVITPTIIGVIIRTDMMIEAMHRVTIMEMAIAVIVDSADKRTK